MTLSDIIGNEHAVSAIADAARNAPFHAYIISGPEGSGKKLAAAVLASGLVCSAQPQARPCGMCPACIKTARGTHPDVQTVTMEGKTSFLVGQTRAVRGDAFILPNEAERKVYILPDSAYMQSSAQNAFLKVLEEPPDYAIFILISENASSLIDTVRSRCINIAMKPVTSEQVRAYLKEHRPELTQAELNAAVSGSGGLIGRAISSLSGADLALETARDICEALGDGSELSLYKAYFKLERGSREEIKRVFNAVISLFRDAVMQKTGLQELLYPAFGNTSKKLCAKYSLHRLMSAEKTACRALFRTDVYLTPGNLLAGTAAELYTSLTTRDQTIH